MITNGSLYTGKDFNVMALYVSNYPDIYQALPRNISGKHIMHVQYGFSNKNNAIDLYLLDKSSKDGVNIQRTIDSRSLSEEYSDYSTLDKIFHDQAIHIDLRSDLAHTSIEKDLFKILACDIKQFCRKESNNKQTSINYVPEIIPVTKIHYSNPKYILTSGKAEFIDGCVLDANLDFVTSNADCVAAFVPGKDSSLVSFKDGIFTGYYVQSDAACTYCYAERNHLEPYPKRFIKINPDKLYNDLMTGNFLSNGKQSGAFVDVLRLGKRTDTGAIYNREQLITTLETCIRAGTKVVLPTKFLEFDPSLVGLLKNSKTSLMYSLADLYNPEMLNEFESGPVMHGCDAAWRIEQAKQYAKAGVNTSIYVMTDTVYPKDKIFFDKLNVLTADGLRIQLLDAKVTKKNIATAITGRTWDELKGPIRTMYSLNLSGEKSSKTIGGYKKQGNKLMPQTIDSTIEQFIGRNLGDIRMCNANKDHTWCGTCFIYQKGFKKKTVEKNIVKNKNVFDKRKKDKYKGHYRLDFG